MKNPYIQQLKLNENEINKNFYLDRILLNEEAGTPLFNEISMLFNSLDIANNLLKQAKIIKSGSGNVKFLDETFTINYTEKIINTNVTELGLDKIIKSNKQLKICVKCVKGNTLPIVILNLLSTGVNRTSILDKVTNSNLFIVPPTANIEINCFAINNKIVPISFFRVIVHEFNHFFESYKRSIKNLNTDFILKNKNIKNIQNNINNDISLRKQEKDALNNIIYTLFSYGELNAFVSSLFGELVSYNVTDKKEFNSIWKELDSFYRYNRLKDNLNVISYIDSDILYKLCKNLTNIKTVNPTAFKNMFLKRCVIKLQKYYNKMMKLVDRYIQKVSDLDQYDVNFYITSN